MQHVATLLETVFHSSTAPCGHGTVERIKTLASHGCYLIVRKTECDYHVPSNNQSRRRLCTPQLSAYRSILQPSEVLRTAIFFLLRVQSSRKRARNEVELLDRTNI